MIPQYNTTNLWDSKEWTPFHFNLFRTVVYREEKNEHRELNRPRLSRTAGKHGRAVVSIAWPVQEIPSQLVAWLSHEERGCRRKRGGLDVWRWKNRRGRGRRGSGTAFQLKGHSTVLSFAFPLSCVFVVISHEFLDTMTCLASRLGGNTPRIVFSCKCWTEMPNENKCEGAVQIIWSEIVWDTW